MVAVWVVVAPNTPFVGVPKVTITVSSLSSEVSETMVIVITPVVGVVPAVTVSGLEVME